MPIPDLFYLLAPTTPEDCVDSMLVTAGLLGLPVTAWQPGSAARTNLTIIGTTLSQFTSTAQLAAAGGFLEYATGDWLTVLANQNFDVQRVDATFAEGTLRLTNGGTNVYVLAAGDVRAYNSGAAPSFTGGTGATYTSTTGGTLNPGSFLDVTIVADVAGSGSNGVVGVVAKLVTPIADVEAVNTTDLFGNDAEGDEALTARCRESMARVTPNGPADAYRYYALSATKTDGSSAGCTRLRVVEGDGTVTLYCASGAGPLLGSTPGTPGAPTDPTTQLGAVHKSVNDNCVPTGISESTFPAVGVNVPVQVAIYIPATSTFTDAEVQGIVGAALIAFFATAPVGGFDYPGLGQGIFTNNIEFAIALAFPGVPIQVVLATPAPVAPTAPAIVLTDNQIAVLTTVVVSVQRS